MYIFSLKVKLTLAKFCCRIELCPLNKKKKRMKKPIFHYDKELSYKKQELLNLCGHLCAPQIFWWCLCCSSFYFSVLCCVHLRFVGGVRVAHLFSFLCCVVLCSPQILLVVSVLCCVHLRLFGGVRVVHLCSFLCCVHLRFVGGVRVVHLFCFLCCVVLCSPQICWWCPFCSSF